MWQSVRWHRENRNELTSTVLTCHFISVCLIKLQNTLQEAFKIILIVVLLSLLYQS